MLHLWNVALTFIFLFILFSYFLFISYLTPDTGMTLSEGWDGREWEGGSGWGTHVHPWQIQVNVWQNQNNVVKSNK